MEIRVIAKETTYGLRHRILRPGEPLEACVYPKDEESIHLGAYLGDELVGVVTAHPEQKQEFSFPNQYRIRGMAVESKCRGQGIGKKLLIALMERCKQQEIPFVWCNAREVAIPFYANAGFLILGDFFELPNIGKHKVMYREI